jgi:hypothetical protein
MYDLAIVVAYGDGGVTPRSNHTPAPD